MLPAVCPILRYLIKKGKKPHKNKDPSQKSVSNAGVKKKTLYIPKLTNSTGEFNSFDYLTDILRATFIT